MPYQNLAISFDDLIAAAERHYASQGYVKWADLAREFGVTRQGIYGRIMKAVEQGRLSKEDLDRYRTVTSRRKASAFKEQTRRLRSFDVTLTTENAIWLHKQAKRRGLHRGDIIDGLVTQARLIHSSQDPSDDFAPPEPVEQG